VFPSPPFGKGGTGGFGPCEWSLRHRTLDIGLRTYKTMTELIIVDGYNIIHQEPYYAKIKDKDLELARAKLVEDLASYQSYTGNKVIVVFDAAGAPAFGRTKRRPLSGAKKAAGGERKGTVLGVEVIFTDQGQSADACIESLAFRGDFDQTVIVATSDYTLQRMIFGKGAYRRTPGELMNGIKEAKEEWKEHQEESARTFLEDRLDKEVREKLKKFTFLEDGPDE